MTKHRDYCLWEETAIDRDYAVHQGGEPIIICHHPQGKGFCDYWEETPDLLNYALLFSLTATPFIKYPSMSKHHFSATF